MSRSTYGTIYSDRLRTRGDLGKLIREPELFAVYIYLTAGPHRNTPGLFDNPMATMAMTMGITLEAATAHMDELAARGMIVMDHEAGVVWVPAVLIDARTAGSIRTANHKKGVATTIERHTSSLDDLIRKCMKTGKFSMGSGCHGDGSPNGTAIQGTESSEQRAVSREHTPAPSSPRAEPASESPAAAETNKAKKALAQWNEMSGQRLRSKTYLSSLKARAKEFSWEEVEAVLQWANTSRHERAQFLMARGNELDTLLRATKFEKYLGFARGDKRPVLKAVPQKPARLIEVRRRLTRSRSRLLVPDGVTVEQMKAQVRDGVEYDLIEDDQEEARG